MKIKMNIATCAFTLLSIIFIGCKGSVSENDLIGNTYELDSYHKIEFKSSNRYWIYQNPLNCGGEGNWSIQNGKIVLGPNDSGCESTRSKSGTYEYGDLN
jgi:hypothetical protein